MRIVGRCIRLGDNISTDHIISGKYKFEAIDSLEKMIPHVFEEVIPGFYKLVGRGDIIVAGENFGKGSSREHAPRLLKALGIGAVVAKSFGFIFFRNSLNVGLPVVESKLVASVAEAGDIIEVDLKEGVVSDLTKGVVERVRPYPEELLEIVREGGLVEYIKRRGRLPWSTE